MKYEHVVDLVCHRPWAILPNAYVTILELIKHQANGGKFTEAVTPRQQSRSGAVAVFTLYARLRQGAGVDAHPWWRYGVSIAGWRRC